jgi:hypothetical protein
MNPHFEGKGSVRVALTAWVRRDGDTALDGALSGWAAPENDDPESGAYPFVFDLPDAATHEDLVLPSTVDVQIAAFAHQASFFESPEAYYASQDPERPKFASQSFIPSGMFFPGADAKTPPQTMAIFTGHVLEAAIRTNSDTSAKFHWALVETLGGTYDVVIDPEVLPGVPVVGGVLSGTFWLSGRLT